MFDASRIPKRLRDDYVQGRCAAVVGAGASIGAGLPSWGDLLVGMAKEAYDQTLISESKLDNYYGLTGDPSKFLTIAGSLKDDLGNEFDEYIEKTFYDTDVEPTEFHRGLVNTSGLQFILTTNYDVLIEKAFAESGKAGTSVLTFQDVGETQRRLSKRKFFLLKAHGDAARVGNGIILTEIDYRDILYRNRAYQSMLSTMFTMYTMIFMGSSMVDPELKLLLTYVSDVFSPSSGPTHYAVMPEEGISEIEKDRWSKDFNVRIIPISKENDFEEAHQFLETLDSLLT